MSIGGGRNAKVQKGEGGRGQGASSSASLTPGGHHQRAPQADYCESSGVHPPHPPPLPILLPSPPPSSPPDTVSATHRRVLGAQCSPLTKHGSWWDVYSCHMYKT